VFHEVSKENSVADEKVDIPTRLYTNVVFSNKKITNKNILALPNINTNPVRSFAYKVLLHPYMV